MSDDIIWHYQHLLRRLKYLTGPQKLSNWRYIEDGLLNICDVQSSFICNDQKVHCYNEWINEWMDGWLDDWMNEWMNAAKHLPLKQ